MDSGQIYHKSETQLLRVENLTVDLRSEDVVHPVIRRVSFGLKDGETLGIVGESGSGKTVTCLSLLKLIPSPPAIFRSGKICYRGRDLFHLRDRELTPYRGKKIAFIFQEALSALNPVMKIGRQVAEAIPGAAEKPGEQVKQEVLELFQRVGIPAGAQRYGQYPHQLSGGLQQRVMIAMALASEPDLLIADEPTTALDVTIQIQILELLKKLQQETGMGMIFVSHDLGVIAQMCTSILVMYAGSVVEMATAGALFKNPIHPYTQKLIAALPVVAKKRGEFEAIPGQVPSINALPSGCKFHPRCPEATEQCKIEEPGLKLLAGGHSVACWQR